MCLNDAASIKKNSKKRDCLILLACQPIEGYFILELGNCAYLYSLCSARVF